MTATGEATLARARAGDGDAFRALIEPHRRELHLHCYRILGSLQDAEDLVQETLLAAWRGLERFEARAALRAWLYRIATNRCLNFLRDRGRRPQTLEPYPDALFDAVADAAPGPEARYELREAVGLTFVATLAKLPPRQRAALVLRDVLGFGTAEVADMLDTGEGSVKGALQRARATLRAELPAADRDREPAPDSAAERELAGRFADAVETGDVDEVVALLTDDALLTMPPQPLSFRGREAVGAFLRHRAELRGAPLLVVPTRANGRPALGCYLPDPRAAIARPHGLIVLSLGSDAIAAITWFGDTGVFRHFGLPPSLRPRPPSSGASPAS